MTPEQESMAIAMATMMWSGLAMGLLFSLLGGAIFETGRRLVRWLLERRAAVIDRAAS